MKPNHTVKTISTTPKALEGAVTTPQAQDDANDLTASQIRYLSYIQAGIETSLALNHVGITSQDLTGWRNDRRFSRAEANIKTAVSIIGVSQAKKIAQANSTYAISEAVRLIADSKRDADKLGAIDRVLKVAGLGDTHGSEATNTLANLLSQAWEAWQSERATKTNDR